jgi:hypothetical protein
VIVERLASADSASAPTSDPPRLEYPNREEVFMGVRKGPLWPLIGILAVALAVACGEDGTKPDDDGNGGGTISRADSIASYWMEALGDSLQNLPDPGDDGSDDYFRNLDYSVIRDGMDEALDLDGNSRVAHLGSGILDVIEINYDPDLWEFLDSLLTYTDEGAPRSFGRPAWKRGGLFLQQGSPVLGNQFSLLATAPRELARRSLAGIPANLTFGRAQELLEDVVMPALESAIDHLQSAESGGGPAIELVLDDETYEIDLGEILVFDASLHAALAAFHVLTAYDVDLFGPDGTYGWVDDLREVDYCDEYGYLEPNGAYYRLVRVNHAREEAARDSILVSIIRHNLEERAAFLTLRGGHMPDAHENLLVARNKLEAAVASIRGEDDPQDTDVIKIIDLVEMDEDIESGQEKPRFAENFTTIEDVLGWIETVLTGTYHVDEPGQTGDIEIDINLSALFLTPTGDWKALLPYHRFTDPSEWITWEEEWWSWGVTLGWEYCWDTCDGARDCSTEIDEIEEHEHRFDLMPIELLNGPGGDPIDLEVEKVPYVPDYTFGGLFPGADRDSWLAVAEAAGW